MFNSLMQENFLTLAHLSDKYQMTHSLALNIFSDGMNKCFKVEIRTSDSGLSWYDAANRCRAGPGFLPDIATFSNEYENGTFTLPFNSFN